MSGNLESVSFNKNYKVLKDTADWLSQQKEPDIDQLVPKVELAMQAYQICKARLDAVQATLAQYFEQDNEDEGRARPVNGDGKTDRARQSDRSDLDDDDDIEF